MNPVRRIAAAALVATMSLGLVATASAPASAIDISWGGAAKTAIER